MATTTTRQTKHFPPPISCVVGGRREEEEELLENEGVEYVRRHTRSARRLLTRATYIGKESRQKEALYKDRTEIELSTKSDPTTVFVLFYAGVRYVYAVPIIRTRSVNSRIGIFCIQFEPPWLPPPYSSLSSGVTRSLTDEVFSFIIGISLNDGPKQPCQIFGQRIRGGKGIPSPFFSFRCTHV